MLIAILYFMAAQVDCETLKKPPGNYGRPKINKRVIN